MKNWKISKIQIQGFKAFVSAYFDLAANTLVTLEGPNGYGKTTVFDAIELLLTGKISRVEKLFSKVMQRGKVNYADNLYWNKKGGKNTLFVKGEFVDQASGTVRSFARFAPSDVLTVASNNRADKFDIFKLCELPTIFSLDFSKTLPENHFDEMFGKNFSKNYSMLNYLHQGENSLIFGSTTAERKGALEGLIDAKNTTEQIEFCGKVEKRLTTLINSQPDKTEIDRLTLLIQQLSGESEVGLAVAYEPLSSRSADWDLEEPFPSVDEQRFLTITSQLSTLIEAVTVKSEIKKRIRNREIDRYLAEKEPLLLLAVKVGAHLGSYENMKSQEARLQVVEQIVQRLAKGGKGILAEDIAFLTSKNVAVPADMTLAVEERLQLTKKAGSANTALTSLLKARKDLLETLPKLPIAHSASCALCGHDWGEKENLIHAIESTSNSLVRELDSLGLELARSIERVDAFIGPLNLQILEEREAVAANVNRPLLVELTNSLSSFENLRKLNSRLEELGITYEADFINEDAILISRKNLLRERIQALKEIENEDPPQNWESIIVESFNSFDDFYAIEESRLLRKCDYVAYKYRNVKNLSLQSAKQQLAGRIMTNNARIAARKRIIELKEVLRRTERSYSSRTIADIELIFHIYSGRLIQNYQRGLGLFIERGDGSKLQFSTAEGSEHDATLSMSSGQISALSMAFFLSLNRVYSNTPFVLIDDPAQSLDDINVASLTDLLRCELGDRQLIMSSHEDDIAAYMRYRFERASLTQRAFHMQTHPTLNASAGMNF